MINVTRRARRPLAGCRPAIESLEGRTLLSGMDIIEAAATRSTYGVDGTGLTAAMIDTGVDYTNPALGGDGFGPGHKVNDGFDFSKGVSNPYPVQPHGTSTAGLVASTDPTNPGVAPGADITALRVFDDNGGGNFDYVAQALQYVIDHHVQDKITVVNLSLSDGGNYSYNFFSNDNSIGQKLEGLIQQLDALNIPVVAATGNSNDGSQGEGFPSILPGVISVTGSDVNDQILPDAQILGPGNGNAQTTLDAPASGLTAPTSDKQWTTVEGTSFAAPLVSGSIILLQQIYEKRFGTLPSVSDVEAWLQGGATQIHDSQFNVNIGRLDVLKSAALIPQAPTAPTPPAPPTPPTPETQVFVDGVLQSTVPSTSASNPLSDFGADAGRPISFNLIQLWQNGQSTTVSLPPGQSDGGTVGSNFTTIQIWDAQATGTVNPVVDPTVTPSTPRPTSSLQGTSTDKIGTTAGIFHTHSTKAHHSVPKPSGFARRGRHR